MVVFLSGMASSNKSARRANCPPTADEVLDLQGHLVLPGLVNTHHHFYQTLTRAVPAAQDANLFNWLKTLYPIWARLTPEDIFISTQTALAELALSGCTTASDHLYLFPNGSRLDDEIAAAREIGMRIQASRGSMTLGEIQGRAAARFGGGYRREHPARQPAADRNLPRPQAGCIRADRPGALLALSA